MAADFKFNKARIFARKFADEHVTFDEVKARAFRYNIPILFSYSTYLIDRYEQAHPGFQVAFLNDIPIHNPRIRVIMNKALKVIFPESFRCLEESSGFYIDEPTLKYYDKSIPEITLEALIRNMSLYLKDTRGDTNYKRYLKKFSEETDVRLNKNNFLDISEVYEIDNSTIDSLSHTISSDDKISPSSIIILSSDGENLSNISNGYNRSNGSNGYNISNISNPSSSSNTSNISNASSISNHSIIYYIIKFNNPIYDPNDTSNNTYRDTSNSNSSASSGSIGAKDANSSTHGLSASSECLHHLNIRREPRPRSPYRLSDIAGIESNCQLFREFVSNSRKLNNNELFGLASVLSKIESGPKKFIDILRSNSYFAGDDKKYSDWSFYLSYTKDYPSKPCDRFCLYKDKCHHDKDILSTAKPKRGAISVLANYGKRQNVTEDEHNEECSLEDAVLDFNKKLTMALTAKDNTIHIINAPTAIGKNTTILNYMAGITIAGPAIAGGAVINATQRYLLAFPSNDLKNEQYAKAIAMGIQVVRSPSLLESKDKLPAKVWNKIERLYQDGRPHWVTNYIKEVIFKKEADEQSLAILRDYLKDLAKFYNSECHAFTTHSRLHSLDYHMLKKYDAIIVDEDPILNCMMPNQIEITMSTLEKILGQIDPGSKLAKKIKGAAKAAREKEFFELPAIPYEEAYDDISMRVDISSFCKAEKFYAKKKSDENNLLESFKPEDSILFFKPLKFNRAIFHNIHRNINYSISDSISIGTNHNLKCIILSATVNQSICNRYFGAGRITFYDCKRAKNTGTLNQYHEHTMSRSDIDKNPGIIDRIVKSTGITDVITFKKYDKGPVYFGKTTGVDFLKGKDLNIIGTPHYPPFIYKLFAYTLGFRVDLNANMSYRPVEHKGFKFWFMTFGDERLQNIQFWMIESELEQAVGRARILREPCNVNLFSNFPLSQAKRKVFEFGSEIVQIAADKSAMADEVQCLI